MVSRSVAAVALTALVSLLAVSPANAETRIAVTPAILDLAGPIGGAGLVEISVTNDGDRPLQLTESNGDLDSAVGLPSATSWTDVAPAGLVVGPGDTATVTVGLDIPDDIEPGGHYTAVSVETIVPNADAEQASSVGGRIVVPVLITVVGDDEHPTPWGEASFDRSALFLRTDGDYVARARISNGGGTHVGLAGTAKVAAVQTGAREPVASFDVPNGYVLPERSRVYTAAGAVSLTPGAAFELTFELSKPEHGRVVDDTPQLQDTVAFVADPELELRDLAACMTPAGELEASVSLVNRGTVGVVPGVSFSTETADGQLTARSRPIAELLAWPGETTIARSTMFAPTVEGDHTLVAEIAVGDDQTVGAEVPIRTGDGGTFPLCAPTSADASG